MSLRIPILALVVLLPSISKAQKPDGVYAGELITQKNALVITSKGTTVKGHVYLTDYEKLEFLGNHVGDSLKGVIIVPAGAEVILLGKVYKDSIAAGVITLGVKTQSTLLKISSNPNYDLKRLFGDQPIERDPLLVGRWNIVRHVLSNGKEENSKYFYEYKADGEMKLDVESIKRKMEENYLKAALQTGSTNKFTFDERWLAKVTWQTSGQKLITTSRSDSMPTSSNEYTYQIKDDTLTITNFKGGKEILVREKEKKE